MKIPSKRYFTTALSSVVDNLDESEDEGNYIMFSIVNLAEIFFSLTKPHFMVTNRDRRLNGVFISKAIIYFGEILKFGIELFSFN